VLQKRLKDVMEWLQPEGRALAYDILEELVTSQETKAVKTAMELATAMEERSSRLNPVLDQLVQARLIRIVERDDDRIAYELSHEYLVSEIRVRPETQARKLAEELILQEMNNWRRFGVLLAADKLALIGEVREIIRLNAEAQEFLMRSALHVGCDVAYWVDRVNDVSQRIAVLGEIAGSDSHIVRRRVAVVLGTQQIPGSIDPLVALAIHDVDVSVRATARQSLIGMLRQHPLIIAKLQSELKEADSVTYGRVMQTLSKFPLGQTPSKLRSRILITRLLPLVVQYIGWTMACGVGWALALSMGLAVGRIAFGVDSSSVFGADIWTEFGARQAVIWAVFGAVVGAAMGMTQWVILRRQGYWATLWILNSTVGWAIGLTLGLATIWVLGLGVGRAVSGAVLGVVLGTAVGLMQWIVLCERFDRSTWWIPVNSLSWAAGWALGWTGDGLARGSMIGLVGGGLTGVVLVWLLWNHRLNGPGQSPL
jgi:hypothetical protein